MCDEVVRCPFCGALMQCCSFYNQNTLYGHRELSYAYKCTECGAAAPAVKVDRTYWSCGGGRTEEFVERAKRLAWEKAVVRKAKFDDVEV